MVCASVPLKSQAVSDRLLRLFALEYDYAAVYDGPRDADVVYEGRVAVLPNGWVELGDGTLVSPETVRRIEDLSLPETD